MQKISICQVCGSIITRSIPRCLNCGEQTKIQVLYEWTPNDELEMAGDLETEFDPFDDTDSLLDMLEISWAMFDKLNEDRAQLLEDRDHYKDECKAAEGMIDKQIKEVKELEAHIKELRAKADEVVQTPEQPKKKGFFK